MTPAVEKALCWVGRCAPGSSSAPSPGSTPSSTCCARWSSAPRPTRRLRLAELRRRRARDRRRDRPGRAGGRGPCSTRRPAGPVPAVRRPPPGSCCPTSARWRTTSATSTASCGSRSPAGPGPRAQLLDDVLGSRSSIAESDQGRSFQAFYDFLLSHPRQEELTELLERVQALDDHRRQRPAPAPHPLRLARRRRTDPGDRPAAVRTAAPLPRRPGVAGEPAGDRHPAQHRGQGARSSATQPKPSLTIEIDDGMHRRSCCRWSGPLYRRAGQSGPRQRAGSTPGRTSSTPTLCSSRSTSTRPGWSAGVREPLQPQPQVGLARRARRARRWSRGWPSWSTYLSLTDDRPSGWSSTNRPPSGSAGTTGRRRTRVADLPRVTFARTPVARRSCSGRRGMSVAPPPVPTVGTESAARASPSLMKGVVYRDTHEKAVAPAAPAAASRCATTSPMMGLHGRRRRGRGLRLPAQPADDDDDGDEDAATARG